jgi:general secretion pathway protein J
MTSTLRKSQPWWYGSSGMTLIELLVALVIFAILGVMGYRATAVAVESRERIAAEMQRWRDIANFLQIVEMDLIQRVERPAQVVVEGAAKPSASFLVRPSSDGLEFSFLKLDGGGGRPGRRGYRFKDGQVWQLRWPGTDDQSEPEPFVVLEKVDALHCTVIVSDGTRYTTWPDEQTGGTNKPVAVEIEMELPDVGTIRRLIAL